MEGEAGKEHGAVGSQVGFGEAGEDSCALGVLFLVFPLEAFVPGMLFAVAMRAGSKKVSWEVSAKQEESCTNWGTRVGRGREVYTGHTDLQTANLP